MSSLSDISNDLATRLRTRRDARSLSQRETAEELGVSVRTLQNWEAGVGIPWPKHRRALVRFLREDEAS
jgi:transcriptional regulator with XRE-family HTH domain